MLFEDRADAGRQLATRLLRYKDERPVVLGLPRGGVPVAYEIARALDAPLDVIVVRKLGAPDQPELGIGAIVDGDHPQLVLNENLLHQLPVSRQYIETEVARQLDEVRRRQALLRSGRPQRRPRRPDGHRGRRRHGNGRHRACGAPGCATRQPPPHRARRRRGAAGDDGGSPDGCG